MVFTADNAEAARTSQMALHTAHRIGAPGSSISFLPDVLRNPLNVLKVFGYEFLVLHCNAKCLFDKFDQLKNTGGIDEPFLKE